MSWRIVAATLSCLIFGLCTQPRKAPPPALPPRPRHIASIEPLLDDEDGEDSTTNLGPSTADNFLRALANSTYENPTDPRLRLELKYILQAVPITELLTLQILSGLQSFVDKQLVVDKALNAAFLQACEILRKLKIDGNDEVKSTLVALGALALTAPWLTPSLGIREIGLMRGEDPRCPHIARINTTDERVETWIAKWQDQHKKKIPREVLYMYLKQLGMSFSLMR